MQSDEPCWRLAAAIVRQAFDDLRPTASTLHHDRQLAAGHLRRDAARFLLVELWDDDNLWAAILDPALSRRHVEREVPRRLALSGVRLRSEDLLSPLPERRVPVV